MVKRFITLGIAFALCLFAADGYGQARDPRWDNIKWQQGPSVGNLGTAANIQVPAGYIFAGANDTRVVLDIGQNPTSGKELGLIAPARFDWFVIFEFDDVGYVRDDEKHSLDADAMMDSIKSGTERANEERKRRGWPVMTVVGWEQKPMYNETTHNLEWAIKGESEGHVSTNYNTRLLGRAGVMRVTLVTDASALAPVLPKFKEVLGSFDFNQGQKYAEFRQGDKIAEYGLSALVVGGAAAVAAKAGLFNGLLKMVAAFWKLIVVGFIALAGFARKLFSRKKTPQPTV